MTAVYYEAVLPSGFLRASRLRTASLGKESVLIKIIDIFYSNSLLSGHISELKSSFSSYGIHFICNDSPLSQWQFSGDSVNRNEHGSIFQGKVASTVALNDPHASWCSHPCEIPSLWVWVKLMPCFSPKECCKGNGISPSWLGYIRKWLPSC